MKLILFSTFGVSWTCIRLDGHIFVTDNLNTHQSESAVLFVAEYCNLNLTAEELGVKGVSGILHNMESRKAFLEEETHRIRFVYTPKKV